MSVVGRFEILSPVFAGAVDTSTARDPNTGETVLLHILPPGHEESPQAFFMELAPGCPGKILDSGIDSETKRAFVVTDYPKDRKAVRLWIRELSGIGTPAKPAPPPSAPPKPPADEAGASTRFFDPSAIYAQSAVPPAPAPAAPAMQAAQERRPIADDPFAAYVTPPKPFPAPVPPPEGGATRMFDPSAVFGGPSAAAAQPARAHEPPTPPTPPPDTATRMFDPSAVFGTPVAPKAKEAAPAPGPDTATRMFDPSAVFGATPPPKAKEKKEASGPGPDTATRMFNPSAVFGAPDPPTVKPSPEPAQDGATRMFDPSAVFAPPTASSAKAAKSKTKPADEAVADSAKRAAEEFISGRLPEEFRSAPIKVQRSLEELLGKKAQDSGPHEEPTPGRPGVITLLFDAYGKRVEEAEKQSAPEPPADKKTPEAEPPGSGATKMISSSDLSSFFAASPGAPKGNSPAEKNAGRDEPDSRDRK